MAYLSRIREPVPLDLKLRIIIIWAWIGGSYCHGSLWFQIVFSSPTVLSALAVSKQRYGQC